MITYSTYEPKMDSTSSGLTTSELRSKPAALMGGIGADSWDIWKGSITAQRYKQVLEEHLL